MAAKKRGSGSASQKARKSARQKPAAKVPVSRLLPPRQRRAEVESKRDGILAELDRLYPEVLCALEHANAFELLVATILSAQCTDERVNLVTPALYARCPGPSELAVIPIAELERLIYSTGFYRNKARNLQSMARDLVQRHGGEVPRSMEALLALAGVARKTANVVLGTAFGIADGVVVDTHVTRLARRLGWTRHEGAVPIERDLMRLIPRERWIWLSHALIWHGRRVCTARKPLCNACTLRPLCPSAAQFASWPGTSAETAYEDGPADRAEGGELV